MSRRDELSEAGKIAYDAAIRHYVERGNTEEHCHVFLDHLSEDYLINTVYAAIQKEKEIGNVATKVNLLGG